MGEVSQDLAIVGLGITQQGRVPDTSPEEMRVSGLRLAIEDAGLKPSAIGGYIYQQGTVDTFQFAPGGRTPKALGMAPKFIWSLQGGGTSAIAGIAAAAGPLQSGLCDYVAIGYGDSALSYAKNAPMRPDRLMPDNGAAYGIMGPAADHALAARRHMHEFGTTKEQLGAVALSARDYAAKRPDAYLHDRPLSMQDYLDARPIAEPLGKYDCCLIADGGCAFIVTTADRAADMATTPVRVSGYGFAHTIAEGFERQQFNRSGVGTAKDDAFRSAGLTLEDVDVAQVYDCFTIEVLMALEALGFCKEGESGPFVADGNLAADAPIPINTAGGELAWGYMQGFTSLVEGIRQLRGEGGATQVHDAQTCLITGHGSTAQGVGNVEYADAALVLQRGL